MANDSEQDAGPEWMGNLPLRSEEIGFSPDALVECKVCSKKNAPNRATCLYCGAVLGSSGVTRLDIRQLESWENGFNVILVESSGVDADRTAEQVASVFGADRDVVRSAITAGKRVPLARVESESQAVSVSEALAGLGVKTVIVSDESLRAASPPSRLRSIIFDADQIKLELFNGGEVISIGSDDLALIVPGVVIEERSESVEKRKLLGTKVLDESETSSHESVVDIYSTGDAAGWRIPASGFDYSCLGAEKSLIAAANMKLLIAKLSGFAPSAKVIDDYTSVRPMLESAWPAELERETTRVGRSRKHTSNVLTSSNKSQLTRYSRLQWRLYEKKV